jgi:hypothetical protein
MISVVHIAPQLPPAIDGVGDYVANLWRHWPDSTANWKFVVTRGLEETQGASPEMQVRAFDLNEDSLASALNQTGAEVAVLHYVGYAYQPKGMPIWLPRAIRRWKEAQPGRRLVTMFHEMYAKSSPLRSPFWVAPFARRIIRELVQLSDAWMTNCDRYLNQLITEFNARAELGRMLPIGSNIPLVVSPPLVRPNHPPFRVVVFGLARTRLWALERHWQLLRAMQERGLLECFTLLGKSNEPEEEREWQRFASRIGITTSEQKFDLPGENVSRELATHDFGLLANEPDILTKSGVFAALANHGVIPILAASAPAALPAFTTEAVLVNDENPTTIATLLETIRDPIRLQRTREQLVKAAAEHLAWPRISRRWQEVLQRITATTPSPSRPVKLPILTNA